MLDLPIQTVDSIGCTFAQFQRTQRLRRRSSSRTASRSLHPQPDSKLLHLPAEILAHIVAQMPKRDCAQMRLAHPVLFDVVAQRPHSPFLANIARAVSPANVQLLTPALDRMLPQCKSLALHETDYRGHASAWVPGQRLRYQTLFVRPMVQLRHLQLLGCFEEASLVAMGAGQWHNLRSLHIESSDYLFTAASMRALFVPGRFPALCDLTLDGAHEEEDGALLLRLSAPTLPALRRLSCDLVAPEVMAQTHALLLLSGGFAQLERLCLRLGERRPLAPPVVRMGPMQSLLQLPMPQLQEIRLTGRFSSKPLLALSTQPRAALQVLHVDRVGPGVIGADADTFLQQGFFPQLRALWLSGLGFVAQSSLLALLGRHKMARLQDLRLSLVPQPLLLPEAQALQETNPLAALKTLDVRFRAQQPGAPAGPNYSLFTLPLLALERLAVHGELAVEHVQPLLAQSWPNLQRFALRARTPGRGGVTEQLVSNSRFAGLACLHVGETEALGDSRDMRLFAMPHFAGLRDLQVALHSDWAPVGTALSQTVLPQLQRLSVTLMGPMRGNSHVHSEPAYKHGAYALFDVQLPQLQQLAIFGEGSDVVLRQLGRGRWPQLQRLQMAFDQLALHAAQVRMLFGNGAFVGITELDIDEPRHLSSQRIVPALSRASLPALQTLRLGSKRLLMQQEDLEAAQAMGAWRQLRHLHLAFESCGIDSFGPLLRLGNGALASLSLVFEDAAYWNNWRTTHMAVLRATAMPWLQDLRIATAVLPETPEVTQHLAMSQLKHALWRHAVETPMPNLRYVSVVGWH